MAKKKQSNDLKTSLEAIRQINWFDGIHQLPNDIDKKLLDQCSDMIQEFIDSNELLPEKITQSKPKKQKRQGLSLVSKAKQTKRKITKIKRTKLKRTPQKIKSRVKKLKKITQSFNYAKMSSTNGYPCYPSAFPCFRSCGPINCPKNKLPMPRDLWYRIVYSQALEQQLGSGEAFAPQTHLQSPSKRKHKEDKSAVDHLHENISASNNPRQQQTMNAAISSTSAKIIKVDVSSKFHDHLHKSGTGTSLTNSMLEWNQENTKSAPSNSYQPFPLDHLEYTAETLPLEIEHKHSQSKDLVQPKIESKETLKTTFWKPNLDKTILSTQSADAKLIHRPNIHRGISVDATLERTIPIPSAPSISIILNNHEEVISSSIQPDKSNLSVQQPMHTNTDDYSPVDSSILFEHPLTNQLFEYYSLNDIPRVHLSKRLNRRLIHIRQTLEIMSANEIELKLKYKRDALVKKRQTPVQSLTKDERIAMAELELNVYEYVQALDKPSSKYLHVNNNDEVEPEQLSSTSPRLPSYDTVLPVVKSAMLSESSIAPSISTFNTVRPSAISQSTARLSTITQFSEKPGCFTSDILKSISFYLPEKVATWNHPLESNLMNMFEQLTPLHKTQIHKQLARRYEHICKKAQELSTTQLQAQIDSKSKALTQSRKILQPNEDDLLRIAELELCLFELKNEQTQRN